MYQPVIHRARRKRKKKSFKQHVGSSSINHFTRLIDRLAYIYWGGGEEKKKLFYALNTKLPWAFSLSVAPREREIISHFASLCISPLREREREREERRDFRKREKKYFPFSRARVFMVIQAPLRWSFRFIFHSMLKIFKDFFFFEGFCYSLD